MSLRRSLHHLTWNKVAIQGNKYNNNPAPLPSSVLCPLSSVHTVIFLMTTIHACSIQFDDVELTVDIWEIFGAWGSNGSTVFGGYIPKSKICRQCWNDNNLCLLCSVVVCVPAYVRAQSCCTENTVTTRGVKETQLVTGRKYVEILYLWWLYRSISTKSH